MEDGWWGVEGPERGWLVGEGARGRGAVARGVSSLDKRESV